MLRYERETSELMERSRRGELTDAEFMKELYNCLGRCAPELRPKELDNVIKKLDSAKDVLTLELLKKWRGPKSSKDIA
jgi:hypothetical protein